MIVVYPMIVSNAVSENTLPALSKMLEQYILIYMHDDLISFLNEKGNIQSANMQLRYKIKGKKIVGESIDLSEVEAWEDEGSGPKGEQQRRKDAEEERKKQNKKREDEKEKKRRDESLYQKRKADKAKRDAIDRDRELAKKEKKSREAEPGAYKDKKERDEAEREKKRDEAEEKRAKDKSRGLAAKEKREADKHAEEEARGAKIDIKVGSDKAITLEPTWMTVNTDKHGTQMIGIKVVPYRVNSDVKLSHLLMHDIKINAMYALTIRLGRYIMGKLLRLVYKGPVSGDPKKDIIYRTTGHKGETFVVLERNHDVDEYFLRNIKKINRLFKLGWGNFVIADDAIQMAHFCMRASKGICQVISYRMMYKTLGQSGVYEDLEDIRKQNSSLFKMKRVRFSKLLGESNAENKLINYQERQ
jgi:hypothetical protein